ncbi:MAG TPA: ATP-binding protein [Opitutaceae bacterium]|nr:ATP-binding protein [Opitutaceae bacterium]
MLTSSSQTGDFFRYRLDAVAFALLASVACYACWLFVRRRGARQDFSRTTFVLLVALALAAAGFAEWTTQPFPTWLKSLPALRGLAFASVAVLVGVLLSSATLVALMRAKIREQGVIEHELQRAKTDADSASRAKSDFLAVMSHEIRTPLNAVMGFADLLAETKLDEAQRDYLATISSEGRRLTALINNILDLTKIEEGRLVLERLPFAPVETANEVLRLLSPRALEKKLELRFEAQIAGPLLVAGDPLRFRQILLNLIDNAIKFTPAGSVTLFLLWTPPPPGAHDGTLAVQVRDTGIGIPAAKLPDLFQMFVQADTSTTRRYGGTGLGLAICQRLVGLMGGRIAVHSEVDRGTEFSFTLPVAPVAPPTEAAPEKSEPLLPPARRPRVLVVDDMDTNRFLLEVFLRRNGFEPALAASGEEAVRAAAEINYDAILMDLHMPDIDGFTATQRIRAQEPVGQRTPIIALTASIAAGTREKCLAAGMDEYLAKPLDLKKFKLLLNQFIGPDEPPRRESAPVRETVPVA